MMGNFHLWMYVGRVSQKLYGIRRKPARVPGKDFRMKRIPWHWGSSRAFRRGGLQEAAEYNRRHSRRNHAAPHQSWPLNMSAMVNGYRTFPINGKSGARRS